MIKRLLILACTAICLLTPAAAYASSPLQKACDAGGDTSSSAVCDNKNNTTNPLVGHNGLLRKISLVLATIAGIVAVIIIIIAGLQMVTSGGDAQKVAGARSAIIGALVGLIIIMVSESLILFVVNKL